MPEDLLELLEKELPLDKLPLDAREKALSGLGESIMKQIIIDVYQYVPEAQIKEMDTKVESDDVDGLLTYIHEHVPQAEALIQESAKKVIADFKKSFAG